MKVSFGKRMARTAIVAEAGTVRQMFSDILRSLGFKDLVVLASGQDAVSLLEVEECDWLLMPVMSQSPVNALQILHIIANTPRLNRVRASLFCDANDEVCLPTAFGLGLMSCHTRSYLREDVLNDLKALLDCVKDNCWKSPLVAATYLRNQLKKAKQFHSLLTLEQSLLTIFPGSPNVLLKLGKAQLLNDKNKEGLLTLHQATIIDENVKEEADRVGMRLVNAKPVAPRGAEGSSPNVLGIKTCVVVDGDSAVLNGIKEFLEGVGVPRIVLFDDGEKAWNWLVENGEPDLILQEWRLRGISGPMLLQRARQNGFYKAVINVVSSVIKPSELPLLKEMGVDDVIAKPFSRQTFYRSVIWSLQQNVSPTERGSLERKISTLLKTGRKEEAERLKRVYMADTLIPTAAKKTMQAEFAFHFGAYHDARDLGIEALRLEGDSLRLLNLIGKALIKLGDHQNALKFFEKAHNLSPLNIEHLCNLAVSQFDSGNVSEADSTMALAKNLDGKNEMVGQTECQLAILGGQADKAKDLMTQLQSINKIVAFMNNRAVALSRCGRYEDGIKLYRQTAQSLPAESTEIQDVVTYNLGLAYAKYGELTLSLEALKPLAGRPNSPIFNKAQSLSLRIREAEHSGGALTFYEGATESAHVAEPKNKEHGDSNAGTPAIEAALFSERGHHCLFGIFQEAALDPEAKRMLDHIPHFTERAAIGSAETVSKDAKPRGRS